ncbi:tetratricopeptide repeat protein [Neoaquamicrobium sediminum]|uniref:tetratricopeptide repeat protein n=1 Tax=Neoaquamicrobium sediminum TaxID=1849104 RepID=UPI001564C40A|nr:hypothetical protein [Mesorhizobium sediminum]NRC55060.1 hypothetical protein [Mesorhizobium sediminum]
MVGAVAWAALATAAEGPALAVVAEPASGAFILASQLGVQLQSSRNDECAAALHRLVKQAERSIQRQIENAEFSEAVRQVFQDFNDTFPQIRPSIGELVEQWRLDPKSIATGMMKKFSLYSDVYSTNHVARQAINSVFERAVSSFKDDPNLYQKLEPSIARTTLSDLGWLRSVVAQIQIEQHRQGRQTEQILHLLHTKLGLSECDESPGADLERVADALHSTPTDLVAILWEVAQRGISATQMVEAVTDASNQLKHSRAELRELSRLAIEIPEIESHIATARAALENRHQIDLAAAQRAVQAAKAEYGQAILRRRRAEAVNMARLSEVEASMAMTRSDFLSAASLFGEAAAALPETDVAMISDQYFKQGEALYQHGARFGVLKSYKRAVDAYTKALHVSKGDSIHDWPMTKNNVGNTLSRLGEREGGAAGRQNLKLAVDAYCDALKLYTKQTMPHEWAMVQNNLGNAYSKLSDLQGGAVRRKSLELAVSAYKQALTVNRKKTRPGQWASVKSNLGNAFVRLGKRKGREGQQNLELAIRAYRAALGVESTATVWAMIKNNLGNTYKRLAQLDRSKAGLKKLDRAIEAYTDALDVYNYEATPADWAMTKNNLGTALAMLGERGGLNAEGHLNLAVEAFNEALTIYTEEDSATDWAMVKANLGKTFYRLGTHYAPRHENLKLAVSAFSDALTVYTKQKMPADWATTDRQLRKALKELEDHK